MLTEIFVKVAEDKIVRAFDIELDVEFKLNVSVSQNYLRGKINDYKFKLNLKFSDIKEVTLEELNSLFSTLFKFVIPQINTILKEGIPLPPIEPFFDLSKSELTLLDQYIRVDFTPVPRPKFIYEFISQAIQKLSKMYKKTQVSRQLRQQRPKSMPEWIKAEY